MGISELGGPKPAIPPPTQNPATATAAATQNPATATAAATPASGKKAVEAAGAKAGSSSAKAAPTVAPGVSTGVGLEAAELDSSNWSSLTTSASNYQAWTSFCATATASLTDTATATGPVAARLPEVPVCECLAEALQLGKVGAYQNRLPQLAARLARVLTTSLMPPLGAGQEQEEQEDSMTGALLCLTP